MSSHSSTAALPGTFSKPRIITLVASLLAALSAGTNYVFSAYGPQLGARLQISHTQLNLIGLGGNVGVYLSGPFWGSIVDKRGPRIPLLSAFLLLLIGYSGIRLIYDGGIPESSQSLPTILLGLLIMFSFMTGMGGNAGLASAINSTAKSFPDTVRGSTTGLVISGFGLSAFAFSTIAHLAFPGNTSSFLLVLAIGTSFPMVIGFFFVRPIPLPSSGAIQQDYEDIDYAEAEAASLVPSVLNHQNSSQTTLLAHDEELARGGHHQDPTTPSEEYIPDARVSVELASPTRSQANRSRSRSHIRGRRSFSRTGRPLIEHGPNIFGKALWTSIDFWILFVSLSLASGTGLMYINNVGSMSQALYIHDSPSTYDEVEASQWQATQVSTISFMNFLGRILIGLLSDFVKARFQIPRSYLLIVVSGIVLSSQITASRIDEVSNLWKSSALLGLGYGSVFSLYAAIVIEWFGLPHFSENWGYLSLSPLFGGNIFSVAFGRNLDAHESPATPEMLSNATITSELPARQCLDGRSCYVDSLQLTIGACLLSMLLSAWAAWRDRRRNTALLEEDAIRRPEVIWEEAEE
ncbi:MFS general substrate transporter [Dendrothele bispora CBS 962.96]|uniref:MFS general substrate transporter n=1 Tax=Dendrothele bispora (strain CBS 962.96) TaxID=1314807 RepID=A0A4S8M428_DENBC|nr:MFS general substrate transporter [Dendrothele bispora CBS 962.96]